MSGRLVASTTLTDGSAATRTPASSAMPPPPRGRRERPQRRAPQHHRVLLARARRRGRPTSRALRPVSAEPCLHVRGDRSSPTGTPAMASAATSGALDAVEPAGHAARRAQRPHQLLRRSLDPRSCEVDDRAVDVRLEPDRVEHSLVERADVVGLGHEPAPGRDVVLGQGTGRREHDVRRHVALLDRDVGPGAVVDDQAAGASGAGHTESRPSSRDHVGRTHWLLEPRHDEVAVTHRLGAEGLHRRPLRAGDEPGRRRERGHPDGDGRRTYGVRQHGRPQVGAVGDDDQHALVAPGHRARREIHRAVDRRRARGREHEPARRPGRGMRERARGARQTSRRSHDGSRWTSGRSARGSQVLVTKSMTWTPGGASIRSRPGTSSPRPAAMAV